jgi:phage baseplate assembly protein V
MRQPVAQTESPNEAARRVGNVVRLGTVAEVRLSAPARCRVRTGEMVTGWLPWITLRAGGKVGGTAWWPPVVGEQCVLLSPGGDLAQGVALPGVYSDAMPQASEQAGVFRLDWSESDYMEYAGNELRIEVGGSTMHMQSGSIKLSAGGGTLVVDGSGAHGEPDVTTGSISLKNHLHGGVLPGPSLTTPPVGG